MPKLRSTYDGRLIYKTSDKERTAFLRYDSNGTNGCVCVCFFNSFRPVFCSWSLSTQATATAPSRCPQLAFGTVCRLTSSRHHRWSSSNNGSTHCSSVTRSISGSLTRMTVAEFYFLLLSALEVFWLHGTIIIFVFNNNNNPGDLYYLGNN